jgi:hypothetical protein
MPIMDQWTMASECSGSVRSRGPGEVPLMWVLLSARLCRWALLRIALPLLVRGARTLAGRPRTSTRAQYRDQGAARRRGVAIEGRPRGFVPAVNPEVLYDVGTMAERES